MKPSEIIALCALACGGLVAFGLWWFVPSWPWWVYVVVAFLAGGGAYRIWLEMISNEKIIDRGNWPNKRE